MSASFVILAHSVVPLHTEAQGSSLEKDVVVLEQKVLRERVLPFQRLAIELFRRQTSRSSSPPDQRPGGGRQPSEREPRLGKTEDVFQVVSTDAKEREQDEKTQQDDSNVSGCTSLLLGSEAVSGGSAAVYKPMSHVSRSCRTGTWRWTA